MTYFKIGTTLVRASHILAVTQSDDDGLLLALLGGADIHLDRDQAALFRAYLAHVPGRGSWQTSDVTGLGTVIEIIERGGSDPGVTERPASAPAPDYLRFD